MCFEVILIHFWVYEGSGNVAADFMSWNRRIAVSSFMLVSFILGGGYLFNWREAPHKLSNRIKRLGVPILFWAVVYFVVFYAAQIVLHLDSDIKPTDLIWQILTGHSYNAPMWFQNDLLYLSSLVVMICAIANKSAKMSVLVLLFIASFVLQYTGLTGAWFGDMRNELKYPVGRGIEMIPYVVAGTLLCVTGFVRYLERHRYLSIGMLLIIGAVMYNFWNIKAGYNFGSAGLLLFIESMVLTLIFVLLPLNRISSSAQRIVKCVARYTMGIYCLHVMIGTIFNKLIMPKLGLPTNSFVECVAIFIVCLGLCFVLSRLPWKWGKQVVS